MKWAYGPLLANGPLSENVWCVSFLAQWASQETGIGEAQWASRTLSKNRHPIMAQLQHAQLIINYCPSHAYVNELYNMII